MTDFNIVKHPLPRLDAVDKARGVYEYGMDHHEGGELQAVILRSPHPHARILSVDVSQAEELEGVRTVIVGRDLPDTCMPGVVVDQPPLARERVRYYGEPVAILAAETRELAQQAVAQIQVEYEPIPPLNDPVAAMAEDALLLHENWQEYGAEEGLVRYGNVACHSTLETGDIAAGFSEADFIFEDEFSTHSVHQSHVEPRVATAVAEPSGGMTVYTNTQLPYWIRTNVAHILSIPEENVRIVPTGIGGGFGSKLYPQIEPLLALLAQKTGQPVHMIVPLEDELKAGLPRHPSITRIKTGVMQDGTIVAREASIILDTGAYAGSGPEIASVTVLVLAGPYRINNIRIDAYSVMTNKMNFGAFRGPGGPQANFALESHMDEIARKMDIDPLDFRLRNIVQDGDQIANGQMLEGVGLKETIERVTAAIEWDKPAGKNRGKGMAIGWWTTTGGKSTSLVALDEDGDVVVRVGTQEIGTGAIMGGVPQVVAESMGVGLEDVKLFVTDTSEGLWDFGSQGSRTLFNVGRAAQFAAFELADKIKNLASKMLEEPPERLILRDKSVIVEGSPEERIAFQDLVKLDIHDELKSLAESVPVSAPYEKDRMVSCLYPAFHYPSFHCHAAEVEVDPGTGEVEVVTYAAAHDIGFAVNPALIRGQIHGGVTQGIGMALMEEIIYQDGVMINNNWTDYKLPTLADIPDIQTFIVEHPIEGGGPHGLKGLGESPVIEPPATLANAVFDAVGIRIRSLPLTPEKVLKALKGDRE
jgi:CO/xanthine dehydrogenase Mo-binding subunit